MPLSSPEIAYFELNKQLSLALLNLNDFAVHFGLGDKRSIEKQAALYVVRTVLKDDQADILYKESGKPYLVNNVKISISHSYDRLAVLFSFSEMDIGVDIEKVRDKVLNITEKFLSVIELQDLKNAPIEKYTVYWCVKEALYKALDVPGLNFSEQIAVDSFIYSQEGGEISAYVYDNHFEKKHILHYQVLEHYILVYTVNHFE